MVLFTLITGFLSFAIIASAWSPDNSEDIRDYIIFMASKENVPVKLALDIASCEGGYVKGKTHDSPREHSLGVFQINLMAHKDVTEEQAFNPFFNIGWAIDQLALGNIGMWKGSKSCWDT